MTTPLIGNNPSFLQQQQQSQLALPTQNQNAQGNSIQRPSSAVGNDKARVSKQVTSELEGSEKEERENRRKDRANETYIHYSSSIICTVLTDWDTDLSQVVSGQ